MSAIKTAFFRLTGGRPMVRERYAFTDIVVGRGVWYFRDRLNGRRWMAFGPWDWFRVESAQQSAEARS